MNAEGAPPIVTIIVPVRNERDFIVQMLEQLYNQSYPKDRFEVIVADGMSTDGTPEIVRQFAKSHPDFSLQLLDNPRRLSSAGRNLAVKRGRGDYFLLVDGHAYIPSRNLISDMVRFAQQHGARVLGRPQPLSPPDIDTFQKMVALARQSPLAHSQESLIYSDYQGWASPLSIAVMYRRDVFDEVGYFDESFDAGEDLEFNYRIERRGVQCFTSPLFAVYYYPRKSFAALFRHLHRYGEGRAAFLSKHPTRFRLETLAPMGLVVTNICLVGIGILSPVFWLVLGVLDTAYAMLLAAEGLRLAKCSGARFSWRIPAIIACIHVALGGGLLVGSVRSIARLLGKRSVRMKTGTEAYRSEHLEGRLLAGVNEFLFRKKGLK